MEDRQIIKLFLQRSGSAIAATAKKYGSRLLQLAGNILRDSRDAEEAVNDTYLALWNAIPPEERILSAPTAIRYAATPR